jgi:hypothetical protein
MVARCQFAIARLTPRRPAALLIGSAAPASSARLVSIVTGGRALPVQPSAPWWTSASSADAAAITRVSRDAYLAERFRRRPRTRLQKARAHFARVAR